MTSPPGSGASEDNGDGEIGHRRFLWSAGAPCALMSPQLNHHTGR
jgi:transposase